MIDRGRQIERASEHARAEADFIVPCRFRIVGFKVCRIGRIDNRVLEATRLVALRDESIDPRQLVELVANGYLRLRAVKFSAIAERKESRQLIIDARAIPGNADAAREVEPLHGVPS